MNNNKLTMLSTQVFSFISRYRTANLFIHKSAINCATKHVYIYQIQTNSALYPFVHSPTMEPVILAPELQQHNNRLGGPRLCCPEGTVAVGNLGASNPRGRRTETSPSAAIG